MNEPVKNVAASIRARVRNRAELLGRPFAEILQYYAMERFLNRLSKTNYAEKFVLKGGLLFYAWNLHPRRPTRDIDFRGYVSHNRGTLLKIIKEVIAESVPEDGIVFDPRSVSVEETQIDADYQGIRVKITALLDRSRIPVQIDIGFSDELASRAESIQYPAILPDLKTVRMKGYPKESVIAEKFHAMVRHAELNSRMKDYYDLWLIVETFEFEGRTVQKAIETTFRKRETEVPGEKPTSLSSDYARLNQARWIRFLEKMEMENDQVLGFQNVVERIWEFLSPPLQSLNEGTTLLHDWTPHKGWE